MIRPPRSPPLSPTPPLFQPHPASADQDDDFVRAESCARRDGHFFSLARSEEHTSELQSLAYLVCRLLLEKKKLPPHPARYKPNAKVTSHAALPLSDHANTRP